MKSQFKWVYVSSKFNVHTLINKIHFKDVEKNLKVTHVKRVSYHWGYRKQLFHCLRERTKEIISND